MKRILLTSTAMVAFAGAAAAEVTWSGSATIGYNDDIKNGVYFDGDVDITASMELNNGLTAELTYGFELEGLDNGTTGSNGFKGDDNLVITLKSDVASLQYGDVTYAAEDKWSGVTNMAADSFSGQADEEVIKAAVTLGSNEVALSYAIDKSATDQGLEQLSLGASGSVGAFSYNFAYQEEADVLQTAIEGSDADFKESEIVALTLGGTFGGADVKFSYADRSDAAVTAADEEATSIGIEVSYPVGPVTATVFYVAEDDNDATNEDSSYGIQLDYASGPLTATAFYHDGLDEDAGIHLGYDMGNGLSLYAGYSDDDGQYIGGEYDLGGNATLTVSYAEDDLNAANDEIGPRTYLHGATIAVGMSF